MPCKFVTFFFPFPKCTCLYKGAVEPAVRSCWWFGWAREGAAVMVSVGHTLRSDAIKGGQCSLILAHPQCNRPAAQSPPQCPLLLQTPGPPRCTAISQTQTIPTLSTRESGVASKGLNGGGEQLSVVI